MMNGFMEFFFAKNRATILLMSIIVLLGGSLYQSIPKENTPDVKIPIVVVSTNMVGISAEDSESLLVKPMEDVLRNLEGLKKMQSIASPGRGYVVLEFIAGYKMNRAIEDARVKIDEIVSNLPNDANRPKVMEVNLALFPVLSLVLYGDIDDNKMLLLAKEVKRNIESISSVLNARIAQNRDEVTEILVNPKVMQAHGLDVSQITSVIARSNKPVAVGKLDSGYNVKIKTTIKSVSDVMNLPIKVEENDILRVRDIATVNTYFGDEKGFSRYNGRPAIVIDISKRMGENIIDTTNSIKSMMNSLMSYLPSTVKVEYMFDQSLRIKDMLSDLENNVLFAVILVVIIIVSTMNFRSSMFIAFSIPGAFLICIIILYYMSITVNMVVLFSLILAVGMLVDNAIVVNEYADRKMIAGVNKREAYKRAAIDMFWPIVSSTMTTLVVFMPLLFWPGVVGQFMKYLPITLMGALFGSLVCSLIFIPVLGAIFGKASAVDKAEVTKVLAIESGDIKQLGRIMQLYNSVLEVVMMHSGKFVFGSAGFLALTVILYAFLGRGVIFFPYMEPDNALIRVIGRGNLDVKERDRLLLRVEEKILDMKEIRSFYSISGSFVSDHDAPDDMIGKVNLEYIDWRHRRKSREILDEIVERTKDIEGVQVKVEEAKSGPISGKAIDLNIASKDMDVAIEFARDITKAMKESGKFRNITNNLPVPETEWDIKIDRHKSAILGMDIATVSNYINLMTDGLVATKYRPENSNDEIELKVRFPKCYRNLKQLEELFIPTPNGLVPINSLIERTSNRHLVKINRLDGQRVINIKADLKQGLLVNQEIQLLKEWLSKYANSQVQISFKGETEDQDETKKFLSNAFILALIGILTILVMQFNNFYQSFVIMTAVFLSTTGVLLGLLLTHQVFGIVMCGVGIITLAGVVVNNNILLIDAFQLNLDSGMEKRDAIMRAAITRFRPILLTAGTTIIGLLPMITGINIDFFVREITYDAPSSQLWRQLAITIAGGLSFATILTLLFTPALLNLKKKH